MKVETSNLARMSFFGSALVLNSNLALQHVVATLDLDNSLCPSTYLRGRFPQKSTVTYRTDIKRSPKNFYLPCSRVLEARNSGELGEVDSKVVHIRHRNGNPIHLMKDLFSRKVQLHFWFYQLITCTNGLTFDMGFFLW